jgi:integrase
MRGRIFKRTKEAKHWTMVVDVGVDPKTGKRKQLCRTVGSTKKAAEKELAAIIGMVESGKGVKPVKLTLGQYLNQWLDEYAKVNTGPRTYQRYREIVRDNLVPNLGAIPLMELKPHHIQSYYTKALDSGRKDGKGGLSARTVTHYHRLLFEALKYAVKHEMIFRNVAEAVTPPKSKSKKVTVIDGQSVNKLLEAVKDTVYYPIFYTAVYTGMRRSELLGLRWRNVDLDFATIAVTETLHRLNNGSYFYGEPKSKRGKRSIAISPSFALLLRNHKAHQETARLVLGGHLSDSDLVFSMPDGSPISPHAVTWAFVNIRNKLGFAGLRFHDLRHCHASLLLKQGVHPKVVSERLGHSTVGITLDTYSHVLPGLQEAAAAGFEEMLKKAAPEKSCEHSVSISRHKAFERV